MQRWRLTSHALYYKIPYKRLVTKICDLAKYHNRHSSKSKRVTKLSFCQNDPTRSTPFWQKNSLVTHILPIITDNI